MRSAVADRLARLWVRPASREDRNVRYLLAQTALAGVVQGGIVTFLPVFLARLGASTLLVSLLTALPALVTIGLSLPAGLIVARWTRLVATSARWYYLLRLTYLMVALAGLLAPPWGPLLIVLLWGLSAIPSTIANTAWYSVLAAAVAPERRPVINGVRWALLGLVSAGSVALFGEVLEALPFPTGYVAVFLLSALAGFLNVWFYAHLEIDDPPPSAVTTPVARSARLAALVAPLARRSPFRTYTVLTLLLRVGLFLPAGLYSVFWVRDLGASDAWIGWRTTVGNAALTLGYYLWGRYASRSPHRRVLALAGGGLGLYPLLTALTAPETLWLLLVAALVWGLCAAGVDVALFEGLLQTTPDDERPRYVALNTALANLVAFLAPILGAALADGLGVRWALVTAGGCLLGTAALAVRRSV